MTDEIEPKPRHADPLDVASELEMAETQFRVEEVQRRLKQRQAPKADGSYPSADCIECGDDIGLGRLRAASNNIMCIYCASAAERRR